MPPLILSFSPKGEETQTVTLSFPSRCTDRGHRRQVFGDIVDTFSVRYTAKSGGASDAVEASNCDVGTP